MSTLIWCWHYDRWSPASWDVPTAYSGDAYEMLARIKAAGEGDTWPLRRQVIERLGAPFGAHWDGYPTPDKPLILLLGGLGRLVGLFVAANAGLLLAQVTAVLAFYWVAKRWLRIRWEWAAAFALLFAFSYATFHRGLAHFSFVFTWTVPPGLLAAWLVARSRRLEWRSPGTAVCLGAALALGAHNPYHLYFWLQLMAWALVAQWLHGRRRANLQIGAATIAVAMAVFTVMHWEHWFHQDEPAGLPLLSRNYGGTERYALKPVEMFIPPPDHRAAPLAFFGRRYDRWAEWRGETLLPYMGVMAIAGILLLGGVAVRRLLTRRPVPGQALVAAWLLAFASIGGFTNAIAFFTGLQEFRATNRVVIFLVAIALLYLGGRVTRWTAGWPRWGSLAAAAVAVLVGVFDQVPRASTPEETAAIARAVASDCELARDLESALPAGAMVFQLPIVGFPEVKPPWRLGDYEHFRPYLASNQLRFSYGAAKNRARSRWQSDVEDLPARSLARQLEEYGFSALYLDRKGYEDRADAILAELAGLGYGPALEDESGNQVVILLHPAKQPIAPLARRPTYGLGWYPRGDDGLRWAHGPASFTYHNPGARRAYGLQFWLSAEEACVVTLWHEGRRVTSFNVGPEPRLCPVPVLELAPGVNQFRLESDRPARRVGHGRYSLRSFALRQAIIEPQAAGHPHDQPRRVSGLPQ